MNKYLRRIILFIQVFLAFFPIKNIYRVFDLIIKKYIDTQLCMNNAIGVKLSVGVVRINGQYTKWWFTMVWFTIISHVLELKGVRSWGFGTCGGWICAFKQHKCYASKRSMTKTIIVLDVLIIYIEKHVYVYVALNDRTGF